MSEATRPAPAAPLDALLADRVAELLEREGQVSVELEELVDASVSAAIVRTTAALGGFDARTAAEIATAASELASNAVLHAGGGQLDVLVEEGVVVISVVDRGRGSASAVRARLAAPRPALQPGKGLGVGLTAVARLMTGVAVAERQGGGLVVKAWKQR